MGKLINKLFLLIFCTFTVFFMYQLFSKISFNQIVENFRRVNLFFLGITILLYHVLNFFRALRFKMFYDEINFTEMYIISIYHNFFNQTIPYRMGELTHIYFMRKKNVKSSKSISVILYLRIIDFSVISMMLLSMGIYALISEYFVKPWIYVIIGGILSVFSCFGLIFLFKSGVILNFIQGLTGRLFSIKNINQIGEKPPLYKGIKRLVILLLDWLEKFDEKLNYIKHYASKRKIIYITAVQNAVHLTVYIILFKTLGITLDAFTIIINMLLLSYVSLVPLSLVANFGFYEYSFQALMNYEQIQLENPYLTGFMIHIIAVLLYISTLITNGILELLKYSMEKPPR